MAGAAAGVVLLALGALMVLPGCYRRVVSAKGFGADQYQVSESYQENSKVDDWIFGERPAKSGGSRLPKSE